MKKPLRMDDIFKIQGLFHEEYAEFWDFIKQKSDSPFITCFAIWNGWMAPKNGDPEDC